MTFFKNLTQKNIKISNCSFIIYMGLFACLILVFFSNKEAFNFLSTELFNKYHVRITGWSLAHLLLFYVVGKFCPNKFLLFFIFGVSWEIFEKLYGVLTNNELYWTSQGWKGQVTDILMNSLGYTLAHFIF